MFPCEASESFTYWIVMILLMNEKEFKISLLPHNIKIMQELRQRSHIFLIDTLSRNIPDVEGDLLQAMRKVTSLRHESEEKAEADSVNPEEQTKTQ
jgi:hypothetical protein